MKILAVLLLFLSPSYVFAGGDKWNSAKNHSAILAGLNANSAKFQCADNCDHKILNEFPQALSSGAKMVVITSSGDPQSDCHACAPELSLFLFEKSNNQWRQKTALYAFAQWGSWGSVDEEDVAVKKLGPDQSGLILEGGYTGQGYFGAVLEMYLIANGGLQEILDYCTAASNSGAVGEGSKDLEDWDSAYELLPKAGRLADIKVNLINNINGDKSTSLFTYDGKKYISSNADPRLIDECG